VQFCILAVCRSSRCTKFHCQIVQTLSLKEFEVNILCNHHKYFYMLSCCIFNFQNFKFLTVGMVKRVNLHHDAKFRDVRSNHCLDIVIFLFLANVNSRSRSLYAIARPSVCRLQRSCTLLRRSKFSAIFVRSNFRQYFYGIRIGHPLTSTENFTEIVSGEPLRRGS